MQANSRQFKANATAALHQLSPVLDNLRAPGLFDEAQQAAAGDAVSQLIGLTGRTSVQG